MIRAEAVIVNSRGLHARPSSQLAKLAAGFKSKITVKKGDKQADASSVTSLLMLVAPKNTELTIVAKGEDEKEAAAAVLELIAGGFGDGVDSPAVAENPPPADEPPARAMQKIDGVAAGRGAVCGRVHLRLDKAEVPRYQLTAGQIAAEQKRFDAALKKARRELYSVQKKIAEMDGAAEMSPFVHLYRTLLEDPALIKKIHDTIAEQQCNAEWAVKQRGDAVSARFLNIDDSYLRERGADVRHVMRRLLAAMKPGATKKPSQTAGYIVVAAELDPAHIIVLRQRGYAGFATETGGVASHAAILARSIGMPAIVGAKGLLAAAENGDDIVLDMDRGAAVLRPDAAALADYKKTRAAPAANKVKKSAAKKTVGIKTEDGQAISLQANIELPDETGGVLESGADGVGLLRTEFLFLNRDEPPGEDEQFEIYRRVLRDVAPRPVVARTLDLGLDKTGGGFADSSPLGMRAIRYCLARPKLFLTQLRALLRAGRERGNLRILLPMISHPAELEQSAALLNHAREQLRAARLSPPRLPPLGAMIEVPAAVFVMRALSRHLDFFSIGTNDLTQYVLAADRGDERLARYYEHPHPALIQLLAKIVQNADRAGKPVTLCGEMAGNPEMTRLLLSLGLRRFSMSVPQIAALRALAPSLNCKRLTAWRRRLLSADSPDALRARLTRLNASDN